MARSRERFSVGEMRTMLKAASGWIAPGNHGGITLNPCFRAGDCHGWLRRQPECHGAIKSGPVAWFALHPDSAAHQGNQAGRDCQSQSGATKPAGGGGVRLMECLKDECLLLL